MGMLSRWANLIEANLQARIEKSEDPAKLIDAAIKDMKQSHKEARNSLVQAKTSQRLTDRRRIAAEEEAMRCEERALLALQNGQEDEARHWLGQKLAAIERFEVETAAMEQQDAYIEQLQGVEQALSRRLRELPAKKAILLARQSLAEAKGARGVSRLDSSKAVARANEAFEKIEAQVVEAEVEAEVLLGEVTWDSSSISISSARRELAFAQLQKRANKQLGVGSSSDEQSSETILASVSSDA
ncbi:MAG: PspA/IM30 family protein [Myxococcota bacterium]|nr:PspA/IM30 family protein [Myxococcota bacterium]